jgi:hypothetical protein
VPGNVKGLSIICHAWSGHYGYIDSRTLRKKFQEVAMKKPLFWILLAFLSSLLSGCLNFYVYPNPEPPDHSAVIITVVVSAAPLPSATPLSSTGPIVIATAALRTLPTQQPSPTPPQAPSATPTPVPSPTITRAPSDTPYTWGKRLPTPVPDYVPGRGMAVLMGESPYELSILPGGWQAYQIGPSANEWGYLVDINPQGPAPEGAYVESKILPEYFTGQWVDVLWLRAPGILDSLPVSLDLISTQGWDVKYENYTKLTPGEWTGWGMFDNAEGCGGVLDISPDNVDQSGQGATIQNTRVQPEFPGNWIQVIRVQLSNQAVSQNAWLRYSAPGSLGVEQLRKQATLSPSEWNGFVVASSNIHQGYVVEVMPQKKSDNEVAFAVVRPESNGETWNDVLRVYVPEGRPPLEALLRVLAVKVAPK